MIAGGERHTAHAREARAAAMFSVEFPALFTDPSISQTARFCHDVFETHSNLNETPSLANLLLRASFRL
jgi:hypothetical protein